MSLSNVTVPRGLATYSCRLGCLALPRRPETQRNAPTIKVTTATAQITAASPGPVFVFFGFRPRLLTAQLERAVLWKWRNSLDAEKKVTPLPLAQTIVRSYAGKTRCKVSDFLRNATRPAENCTVSKNILQSQAMAFATRTRSPLFNSTPRCNCCRSRQCRRGSDLRFELSC